MPFVRNVSTKILHSGFYFLFNFQLTFTDYVFVICYPYFFDEPKNSLSLQLDVVHLVSKETQYFISIYYIFSSIRF